MKTFYKAIASSIVMFALVLTAFSTPISTAVAVSGLDSQFGFDTSFDFSNTPDYFDNADSNESGVVYSESNSSFTECVLEASQNIITVGDGITLNWSTTGFTSLKLNGDTISGNSGSLNISNIQQNTSYTLEALNDSGSRCLQTVHITCLPPEEPKECELKVTKTVDKHNAVPGDELTYTITVKNIGDADCTGGGVRIFDAIDSNVTYVDNTYTSNLSAGYGSYSVYTASDRTLRFNGHTLTPGESGTIVWTGEVSKPSQCGGFDVKNQAKATAKELNNFQNWAYSPVVKTWVEYKCDVPKEPVCPLTDKDGRTLVYFDGLKLRTDQGIAKANTITVPLTVNPGLYDITLVSWDGYTSRVNTSQPHEQWNLEFMNSGSVVGTSDIIGDLADNVIEATKIEKVNTNYSLTSAATGMRAAHPFYPDTSSANSLYPICAALDYKTVEDKSASVVAHKVVCTDESQLPNYGNGGPDITANTAADWVAANDSCSLVSGWEFEWTDNQSNDPGDTFVGKAGSPWTAFGPTDSSGMASIDIDLDNLSTDRVWFREVLQSGYIPFTHGLNSGTNVDDISAEFYCNTDVLNYDNRDFILGMQDGETYNCVAWNSPVQDTAAPTCDLFTANPTIITVGNSSTLTWETTNAVQVFLNNGIGAVPVDGSISVSPLADIVYILTAIGAEDKTVDCEVPVKVSEDLVPICESFTVTPSVLGVGGGDVTLDWTVSEATTVTIAPTVGTVGLVGTEVVNVTQSTTFVLTATDGNGDQVTCPAPVAVADPEPLTCAGNVNFSATPAVIKKGQNVTLEWSTTDIDSVTITHINLPGLSGSHVVTPADDITYVLTATQGDRSIDCPVSVDVSSGGGGGSSSPRCDLEISDTHIELGDTITLEWDTRNATEVTLMDDRGEIIFTTDDYLASEKREYYDGSITLKPTRDTEYTLLAEKGSKDRECKVEVELDDDVVVLQARDQQPLVAGISLSQVPYTGFEAGAFMTAVFYMLLIGWAFYITYLLVVRKHIAGGLASGAAIMSSEGEVVMRKSEEVRPDAFVASVTPASTVPTNLPIATPVVGYENQTKEVVNNHEVGDTEVTALENRAHAQKTLLSSDAVRHLIGTTSNEAERNEALDAVITEAKKTYPLEDGWLVINESRMVNLCEECKSHSIASKDAPYIPAVVPEGTGSLAEAIVTGNVVAAYQMIGNRPMFALADAAADLDAVYRSRRGGETKVSNLLAEETKSLSDEQIKNMITALTGAIDGTYNDEASAVKMAIMKAVKEVA
ncbi:MAG: DUF11 domain-containing protein [Candidatus Pacebacteria bacterium]|nr:DUF11 domain-containing protein [Candidatus Paceibacterota bacterium]